jgi:hypothetical protein
MVETVSMRSLTARDVRRLRLRSHWLAPRPEASAAAVVEHLGALQAQEIWSGLWSIGARSSALGLDDVQRACEDAEILRTWPLRNTVHFVPAADAHWMLDVAETYAFASVERRREFLGLDERDADKACDVLSVLLESGEPVAREECLAALEDAGVLTERRHGYHLLWFVAQRKVTCIGPQRGSTQTFVKLDRWATHQQAQPTFEESVAELARRYFTGHGPAPAEELKRWTGLGMRVCRSGIARAGDQLTEVPTELGPMLMAAADADALDGAPVEPPEPKRAVLLLSGFDEYVLGYGDRTAIMEPDQLAFVVPGNNDMFRPTIVDDGQVVGVWKRKVTAKRVDITLEPFGRLSKRRLAGIERAADEYGTFLRLPARVLVDA